MFGYFDDLVKELYTNVSRDVKENSNKWIEVYKKIPIGYLPDYVHEAIRGATDLSRIWLRKGMDYTEKIWVLAHEIAHIANPFERNEDMIDYYAPAFVPAAQNILQSGRSEFAMGPYKIPRDDRI
jgi:hypothetical protein